MTTIYFTDGEELSIGRREPCTIVCKNQEELSAVHVVIKRSLANNTSAYGNNQVLMTMSGRNGGYVNGKFISHGETVPLMYSDVIKLFGMSFMWLGEFIAVSVDELVDITSELKPLIITTETQDKCEESGENANLKHDQVMQQIMRKQDELGDAVSYFSKAPRTYFAPARDVIELEAPPEKRTEEGQSAVMSALPALTMALPMIMGFLVSRLAAKGTGAISSTFMYTGLITAICSAILGVIWAVINIKNRSRQQIISEERRRNAYLDYVSESEAKIRECYNRNLSNMHLKYPGVGEYFKKGAAGDIQYDKFLLWNRSRVDEDFLCVRIGTGNIPYDLSIVVPRDRFSVVYDELRSLPRKLKDKYSYLNDVPITVDLIENDCTGVVCDGYAADEMLMLLSVSLAAAVSPEDVAFIFDFQSDIIKHETLETLRFLPHLQNLRGHHQETYVGSPEYIVVFTDRGEESYQGIYQGTYGTTGHVESMGNTETAGIIRIVFARNFRRLPSDCKLIIQKDNSFGGCISLKKINSFRQSVHFDNISIEEAGKYVREMCSVRIRKERERFILPENISFYELFGTKITADFISKEWQNNSTQDEIKIPIGINEDGGILELDLHEKGHGPHGLIAGMTGSGKSEILQTIILSLSVKYPPDEVGFFLIDYKGGGMSELFDGLPHIMGSISNLSGRMINRAMVSVRSENEKRQRIFNSVSVNNISKYRELYKSGVVSKPLPHIFIIIDEFAELKREEPEFMKELISIARVGRSLGIHLLLATQKPSGTVDDNILSNSRFRICLKVQDRMDSMEMLKRPEAASITGPGQAYFQVGNDEVFTKFQGAYTMDKSDALPKKEVLILSEVSGLRLEKSILPTVDASDGIPQLKRVVAGIKSAANNNVDSTNVENLWLPLLPEKIILPEGCSDWGDGFKNVNEDSAFSDGFKNISTETDEVDGFEIPIGIYDNPARQQQGVLRTNIVKSGHHVVLGNLQSGKSTLLATIAYALMSSLSPKMLNMYFIDFSSEILKPFKDAVHTGAYICEENEEDVLKLILMLEREIAKRKKNKQTFPAMIVFIDGFGALRERTKDEFDKNIEFILKNGEVYGIYVVASALNISSVEMPRRIFDCFKVCIPLQLKDRYEYKDALLVQSDAVFMPDSVKGRGLYKSGDCVYEFQAFIPSFLEDVVNGAWAGELASLDRDLNGGFTEEKCDEYSDAYVTKMPVIPGNLTLSVFIQEVKRRVESEEFDLSKFIPVGFDARSGRIFGIPSDKDLTVVISGRDGSGKKNLLNVIHAMCDHDEKYESNTDVQVSESGDEPDDGSALSEKHKAKLNVVIYDEKLPFTELSELKKSIGNDPYVIHLGGGLDRQNVADFSYIPYSKQTELMKPGRGIVRKTLAGYEYGEIRIPKYDLC